MTGAAHMRVELTRFRVRPGKSEAVDDWMAFLNANLPAVLETLDGEKMYVETIFREHLNGDEYLHWFSVQGEGGIMSNQAEHWLDKKHLEFWRECIDPDFPGQDLKVEAVFVPDHIRNVMR